MQGRYLIVSLKSTSLRGVFFYRRYAGAARFCSRSSLKKRVSGCIPVLFENLAEVLAVLGEGGALKCPFQGKKQLTITEKFFEDVKSSSLAELGKNDESEVCC